MALVAVRDCRSIEEVRGTTRATTGCGGCALSVQALLSSKCAGCHTYGQADPAGWGSVLDVSRMIDSDIVVPGDPNNSRLIDRVAVAVGGPDDWADVADLMARRSRRHGARAR